MKAVVTAGNGGFDRLQCRLVKRPQPESGEVLLQVLAAGMNNTEIKTRVGWYSDSVTTSTSDTATSEVHEEEVRQDGGWNKTTPFPFIQGTDCCGRVVEIGPGGDERLLDKRVLIRSCIRPEGFQSMENIWMGSDFDGAFAQFVKAPQTEVFVLECSWSDAELATIPCAYGTAENMIQRCSVTAGERVLITGASGGVGSAAVQLVKRRNAEVIAVAAQAKKAQVLEAGADQVIGRDEDLVQSLGENSVDAVIDLVAGPSFPQLLKALRRGGRYVSAGAIGGPLVSFDTRTFYLKDLQLIGCTAWDEPVFSTLVFVSKRMKSIPCLLKPSRSK